LDIGRLKIKKAFFRRYGERFFGKEVGLLVVQSI